jgi:hypothetical protein
MEEGRLTRIPAHSNARRVNYRQAHLVAALMCDGARFTKPALPIPRAFGADLDGGLDATPLAAYLRCLVSGRSWQVNCTGTARGNVVVVPSRPRACRQRTITGRPAAPESSLKGVVHRLANLVRERRNGRNLMLIRNRKSAGVRGDFSDAQTTRGD